MGYVVLPNGSIVVDSLAAARELQRMILSETKEHPEVPLVVVQKEASPSEPTVSPLEAPPSGRWDATWKAYYDLLRDPSRSNQRSVLALIKGSGIKGLTVQDLAHQLGEGGNSVGGMVGAISKSSRKVGLPPEQVIVRHPDGRFTAGPLLERFDPPEP
jgi:hypothetical protein